MSARAPNYDRFPTVPGGSPAQVVEGWDKIAQSLVATGARIFLLEAYPGVRQGDLRELAARLGGKAFDASQALLPAAKLEAQLVPALGDDPVFGRISNLELEDFFCPRQLLALRQAVANQEGRVVVYGPGAALAADEGLVVYADLARWEAQGRHRAGGPNLGADNGGERPALKYKRAYFVDWRVADRHKQVVWSRVGYFLDTTASGSPKLVEGAVVSAALARCARRPFRVVPFFDPAPWGGHWMQQVCDVGHDQVNLGWCFDCVPEENSLLLEFGSTRFELPSLNLVLREPRALLGEEVHRRFGAEFPIRFDFLDTVGGGNLSLQVHPLASYIQEHFGIPYTQDESYYLLDAKEGAFVYLGLREEISPAQMLADLRKAQQGGPPFAAEKYVNHFAAKKHDHFLIPAGTVHAAGAGAMVLEISATPYIFTFKLWDWGRLGLDGRPRPIHLEHGEQNLRWERDTSWVKAQLVNRVTPLEEGSGWRSERTGLHQSQLIETHRHWFENAVPHLALQTVQVLNLVEGEEAVVESPDLAFEPFAIHYAETFIVPAAAGAYTVRPSGLGHGTRCATLKAFIRPG